MVTRTYTHITSRKLLLVLKCSFLSSVSAVRACLGVCVAERIANYCEAVLNVEDLCKPGLRCCVSRDIYGDREPPPDLIIMDGRNTTRFSTSVPRITTTTTTPPPPARTQAEMHDCQGDCVSGFFALLCDDIDTNAYCPNDGSCCITRPLGGPGPGDHHHHYPMSTTSTTTTTTTTTRRPLPRCPGVCLPEIMSAFCDLPAVIIPETANCQRGTVCCDNTRTTPRPPTTPRPTQSFLPGALGQLGALFTSPRPPPPRITTTTTTPAPKDERPYCPGSCIVSYLSFTCFSKYPTSISFIIYGILNKMSQDMEFCYIYIWGRKRLV